MYLDEGCSQCKNRDPVSDCIPIMCGNLNHDHSETCRLVIFSSVLLRANSVKMLPMTCGG